MFVTFSGGEMVLPSGQFLQGDCGLRESYAEHHQFYLEGNQDHPQLCDKNLPVERIHCASPFVHLYKLLSVQ